MVITTEQSIFDVTLKRAKKSKNPPRPTRRSTTFHIKVNSDEYDALRHYQELYEKANGDLDTFFSEANKLPGVKSEIIKKGSAYHLHFMECTCMLHRQGYVSTPLLCECSKQSILYVLYSLWKDKAFRVTICESILRGSQHCKMQIETTNT